MVFAMRAAKRARFCRELVMLHRSNSRRFCLVFLFAAMNVAADEVPVERERNHGFFVDVSFGWTSIRGNDVQVGDRTTVSPVQSFDDGSRFEPLVTRMESEGVPFGRVGYEGEKWGVEGELWGLTTSGTVEGSFAQADVAPRSEIVRMWDVWHGEDDDETSFRAGNELSFYSGRVHLTRILSPTFSIAVGAHLVRFENERSEEVRVSNTFSFPGFLDPRFSAEETRRGASRSEAWWVGPSFGVRGSTQVGSLVAGFAATQSILFTEVDHEARWERAPLFLEDITVSTSLKSRTSIPVTEFRGTFSLDVGEHVSVGAAGWLSIWYDVPGALEFSIPFEQWREPSSTLVLASIGPFVKLRF
jgi:hypothetical protein